MVFKAVNFYLSYKSLHLFHFFLYSNSRTKGIQLVSQNEILKLNNSPPMHLQDGAKRSLGEMKSEMHNKIH
jgi:hypothetical protein